MQTKSASGLSSNQCSQLRQLNELVRLHKFREKIEELKNELNSLTDETSQYLENQKKFTDHLLSIKGELEIARKEQSNWEIKLEAARNSDPDNKIEVLQNICLLLGYDVSNFKILKNKLQVTLRYRDICYISYSETDQIYDVVDIYPQHPNFLQIQQFFKNSQDLKGLLATLCKFFDIAIHLKENTKHDE